MIPKIIHRVWISEELPDFNTDLGRCFYSQEKLKDYGYEIRTYNSHNFDFSISKYLLQAYSLKKYAFISDYIRVWSIYNFGGIYLDGDVEIVKEFDNDLLKSAYFFMIENWGGESYVYDGIEMAIFGAEPHNKFIKLILDYYNSILFIDNDNIIHDRVYKPYDLIPHIVRDIIYNKNNIEPKFIEDLNEYIELTNNDKSKFYLLKNNWNSYNGNYDENSVCCHFRYGTWVDKNPENHIFNNLSKGKQEEYWKIYNDNKLTNLLNKTYILTNNKDNIKAIHNQFNIINENQIINDIDNIDDNNYILINYDNITDISLFKYLLKNLPDNSCIISNEYNIENSNNISKQDIFNCLLIQNNIDYKQLFNYVYENNIWGNNEEFPYYSGIGSHDEKCVNRSITYINNFIKEHNIKSLLDFGCGDFNIGSKLNIDMYYGVDISKDLIEYNKLKYEDELHKFIFNNESYNNLPSTDLIIIKEVLQHLDNDKIKEILDHLIHITNKYIIIFDTSYNDDININPNLNITNITTLISSKEIKNYNLHPELPPFNYDFKIIDRLHKFDNKYWNIWLYTKNENS